MTIPTRFRVAAATTALILAPLVAGPVFAQTNNGADSQFTRDNTPVASNTTAYDGTSTRSTTSDNSDNWKWLIPLAIAIPLLLWAVSRRRSKTREGHKIYPSSQFYLSGVRGGEVSRDSAERMTDDNDTL